MTLVAKKMARDHRQPPCCSLPSLRHTQSQLPSLHFLVAIIAIVGTGSGPWRARAEVPPELSPVEDRPCASPCQGQCFAGKCLFTGDEPASSGSLTQSSIQGTAANHYSADGASSVTPESVPVESLQSAPVHKHGRLRRHAVREANLLAHAALPVTPTLAPVLAVAPSTVAASTKAWHAGGQHGAQSPQEMHAPTTAMQVGVQPHMVGSQQQLGLFDQPLHQVQLTQQLATQHFQPNEQMLDATLKYEQQVEAALRAENDQLRAELTRWREAGARVADREAKVVDTITSMTRGMSGPWSEVPGQSAMQKDVPRQSLLSTAVERYLLNEDKSPLEDSINSRRLMLIFFVVNALAFLLWVMTGKKGVGSHPGMFEAVLRQAGLGSYIMEVTELQIRNLCICGEAHLSMRMGTAPEVRVEATESLEGDLVKFEGVFTFRVNASHPERNCVLWVMDRDPLSEEERIAHLEVPMRDLLRLVQREHGEYVTFDLEPHGPQSKRRLMGTRTAKPCLALRLRDVTMVPQHNIIKSTSSSNCQVRSDATLTSQRKLEDVAEPQ